MFRGVGLLRPFPDFVFVVVFLFFEGALDSSGRFRIFRGAGFVKPFSDFGGRWSYRANSRIL